MAEQIRDVQEEAGTSTIVLDSEPTSSAQPSVRMKLKKPKGKKKVGWTSDTVDNENMNKKKSKCCCIYEKPREFGESSSESEDECTHCKGHVERKHHKPNSTTIEEQNHQLPLEPSGESK